LGKGVGSFQKKKGLAGRKEEELRRALLERTAGESEPTLKRRKIHPVLWRGKGKSSEDRRGKVVRAAT